MQYDVYDDTGEALELDAASQNVNFIVLFYDWWDN
jgi:hypothetical protein